MGVPQRGWLAEGRGSGPSLMVREEKRGTRRGAEAFLDLNSGRMLWGRRSQWEKTEPAGERSSRVRYLYESLRLSRKIACRRRRLGSEVGKKKRAG